MLKVDTKLTPNVQKSKAKSKQYCCFYWLLLIIIGKNNGWRGGVKMSKTPHKALMQL